MRRGETSADQTSQPTMFVSLLVGSTSTGLSVTPSWQDDISWLRIQNPQACASRTRRCFRSPTSRTAPHDSMIWRTPQAGTARLCDGWRDHFSSFVVPSTHGDFSSEFHCSMTLRFFELTSDQHSSGVFDAPFSESELSKAQQMPRFRTWAGRSSIQHFPTAPSMVARHASRFLQSLVELECGSGCPRLSMVTQRTLTDIDQFLWRLVRSRFSRG